MMNKTALLSTNAAIPIDPYIAVCPICGGKLVAEATAWEMDYFGLYRATEIDIDCEHEPDIDSDEWDAWHKRHYSTPYIDWLPIETKVLEAMKEIAFEV
jgi:hypothetical protein